MRQSHAVFRVPTATRRWGFPFLAYLSLASMVGCAQPVVHPSGADSTADLVSDTPAPTDADPDTGVLPDAAGAEVVQGCLGPSDCPSTAAFCDRATGACVACLYGPHCGPGARCVGHACVAPVPCQTDKACFGADGVCDKAAGFCADCQTDGDCPASTKGPRVCRAHQCIAVPTTCKGSKDCASLGQVCDASAASCVDCTGSADCTTTESCVEGLCLPHVCLPGSVTCSGLDGVATCNGDGSGTSLTPCGSGTACDAGTCLAQVCKPGASDCQGSTVRTCSPGGTAWVNSATCGSSETCVSGACLPHVCLPDSVTCEGAGVRTCAPDGLGTTDSACPNLQTCVEGSCKPLICKAGSAVCDGVQVLQCNAQGTLATVAANCASAGQGCVDGACVPQVCKPGSGTCGETGLQVCNSDGLGWTPQPCKTTEICEAGACKPLVCTPGAKSCNGAQVIQCDAKGLTASVTANCANTSQLCKDGACLDKVCTPGNASCQSAGQVQTCSADGLGYSTQPCAVGTVCEGGVCKATVCTAGVKSCAGAQVQQCDAKGLNQVAVQDCAGAGKLCIDGACVTKVCLAGATLCNGNTLRTCNADGLAYTDKDCGTGTTCDAGQCKTVVCTPGAKTCDGSKVSQCDGKGVSASILQDCAATAKLCLQGVCADKLCDPGTFQCQGSSVAVCSGDGKQWNATPCDDKNPCTIDTCDAKTVTCSSGATKDCNDGLVCTLDECDTWTGNCNHTNIQGKCDDGSACTLGDTCVGSQCLADPYGNVSTIAGTGQSGWQDGAAGSAQFAAPYDVARGVDGSLYVADTGNQRIRKISFDGKTVSTWAGDGQAGYVDGPASQARFNSPAGVAVDKVGAVYVADNGNHRIRKISPDGSVSTLAGTGVAGSQDGQAGVATFQQPLRIAIGASGDVFVTDASHRIRRISPAGMVSTFAGTSQGYKDGPAASAAFNIPYGLMIDPTGVMYVADSGNHRIRKISTDGMVTTLAGSGTAGFLDGPASSAQFNAPMGLTWSLGHIVVADTANHRIRAVLADGTVATIAGSGGQGASDGPGKQAAFNNPRGLAVDPSSGGVFVADLANHRIRKVMPLAVVCQDNSPCTIDSCDAKTGNCVFKALGSGQPCDDGTACTSGETCSPAGVCAGGKAPTCDDGNACTDDSCDPYSGKCAFSKNVSPCSTGDACNLATVCGGGSCAPGQPQVGTLAGQNKGGFQDGPGKSALFLGVNGIARGPVGELYLADQPNHRIRKLTADGTVSTLAGTGIAGNIEGFATDATFNTPSGVAVDKAGNVFVADTGNHRIRRISAGGVVSTFAGSSVGFQDGQGTSAQFNTPWSLAIDPFGNLYVSDAGNQRVRKVSPKGVVTTLAGSGQAGYLDGPASSAQFNTLRGIALDGSGNLFLADTGNLRVRRLTPLGTVTTVAGSGQAGYIDGPSSSAQFNAPMGVAIDLAGNVVVAESVNRRIRLVGKDGTVSTLAGSGAVQWLDGAGTQAAFVNPTCIFVDPVGLVVVGDGPLMRTIAAQVKGCDDGNPCTTDSCDPKTGACSNAKAAVKTPCNDGNACTSGEACDLGGTCVGTAKSCDDTNPCTTDACNPYTAECENVASNGACEDGSACTLSDHCAGGKCVTDVVVVSTLAGGKTQGYLDGASASAQFNGPHGIAIDGNGTIYVTDQSNQRIRKRTQDGQVTTLAGSGQQGYLDGPGSSAQFNSPADVAVDKAGNVYVADAFNNRIRKITSGGTVTTLAGSGQSGYVDGAGSSAKFDTPIGIAIDAGGKVYVADMGNQRIRTIAPDGTVGTLAGSGQQGTVNGPGTSASFSAPNSVTVDATGNVFVTEGNSHDVRRITAAGTVTTLAGGGSGFADGAVAKFNGPSDVIVGADGAVYVADTGNKRIRRIEKDGTVSTWAGSGTTEYKDGDKLQAGFVAPQGLALLADGGIAVADWHGLRRISALGTVCTDGKSCTTDVCDPKTAACSFPVVADGGKCDDGNPCTTGDACASSLCSTSTPTSCDDASACTVDSCDVKTGCVHTFQEGPGCCNPLPWQDTFDDGKPKYGVIANQNGSTTLGWQEWLKSPKSKSAPGVLYYGNPASQNFDFGGSVGQYVTQNFQLGSNPGALTFWLYMDTESGTSYDNLTVTLHVVGGGNATVFTKNAQGFSTQAWYPVKFDLAAFAGKTANVEFYFNTGDSVGNSGLGVLVDDLTVTNKCP
jgi:sugar lactone lactonase YvrE